MAVENRRPRRSGRSRGRSIRRVKVRVGPLDLLVENTPGARRVSPVSHKRCPEGGKTGRYLLPRPLGPVAGGVARDSLVLQTLGPPLKTQRPVYARALLFEVPVDGVSSLRAFSRYAVAPRRTGFRGGGRVCLRVLRQVP